MIEPDERVLKSMMYIHVDAKAKPFLEWLKQNLSENRAAADDLRDDIALRQTQGGNMCLNQIITNIESAFETLRTRHKNIEQDKSAEHGY